MHHAPEVRLDLLLRYGHTLVGAVELKLHMRNGGGRLPPLLLRALESALDEQLSLLSLDDTIPASQAPP